jgi:tetratricopeptide (TPR) repeat protein
MTVKDQKRARPEQIDGVCARVRALRVRTMLAGSVFVAMASQLAPSSYAQTISDRFLSRVTAQENGACATVNIDFNVPVRYVSHFPDRGGRELRIGVQPLNFSRGSLSTALATESLRPPSSKVAGIQRITYDVSDPAGPTLVLQFDHDANWDVKPDRTATRLVITVSGRDGCVPEAGGQASASSGSNIIQSVTQSLPETLEPNGNYAINLLSERGKVLPAEEVKQIDAFGQFAGYQYTAEENGVEWTRLRLGTFATRMEAEQILPQVATAYPEAWIARIDRSERERVYQAWLAARSGTSSQPSALPVDPVSDGLLQELRDVLATGDNAAAIRLAERLLGQPESSATPEAQEILGLARERNKQLAHAKAEYETFIARYPDHPNAARVRQRLAALLGEEPETVRPGQLDEQGRPQTVTSSSVKAELSGSLSMLYQRDESGFLFEDVPVVGGPEVNPDPIEENRTNLNEILYGADINLTVGNDRTEGLLRFSGVFRDDFRAGIQRDEGGVSTLYLDVSDRELNTAVRLGRQTRNTGGIFGRFDGGLLSFQATENLKLNVVGGYPVQSSRDLEVNTDRLLFGGSVDFAMIEDALDTTVYYVHQTYGDLVDRKAVGGEFRYFNSLFTAYGVYDYDLHFGQTNLALLNGALRFEDESSISVAVDYRRSPLLTTLNAIIGQGVENPNDLLTTYQPEDIYQFAQDRTAYSRSASISVSRPITESLQINVDVIATNVSGTKASAGVEAFPSTGTEYYYSGQLVASDVFTEGAILIAGVRYADTMTLEQQTLQVNMRYPILRDLRLNTKLRVDQRNRKDSSSEETSARGSVALSYNLNRSTFFDVELGGQFTDSSNPLVMTQERGLFGTIGLRQDF